MEIKGGRNKIISLDELIQEKENDEEVLIDQFKGMKSRVNEMDLNEEWKKPKANGAYCLYGKPLSLKKINQKGFLQCYV